MYGTFLVLGEKQASSPSKTQQLDTDQHSSNFAAASAATSFPNASSLIRGLPYYESAQDLTNEFLEAAGQPKVKFHERKQRANHLSTPGVAKLAYEERCFRPSNASAALKEGQEEAMISLNGNFNQVTCGQQQPAAASTFNSILRPRAQSGGDDEWVTLNSKPALFSTHEELQKQEEQEKEVDVNSIVVTPQLTHIKDFAYKDDVVDEEIIQGDVSEEPVSKPSHPKTEPDAKKPDAVEEKVTDNKIKNKKTTATSKKATIAVKRSTAFDANTTASSKALNTPIKRRGGRPVGYRKQANGKFAFSDGSTLQSKSQSSNDGGDKKREAPVDDATSDGSNKKRQRKSKGKGSEAGVDEEAVVEKKEKKEKSGKAKKGNA